MKIGSHEVVILDEKTAKVGCQMVTLSEVQQLAKEIQEFNTLKVGDYVLTKASSKGISWDNKYGKIVEKLNYCFIVEFNEIIKNGTLNEKWPKNGHFIEFSPSYLVKAP